MEHFVTLFDSSFLPQGLALYDSLAKHGEQFVLWVVCIDEALETSLARLGRPCLKTISLSEIELRHQQLPSLRISRKHVEYCWTLTPFAPQAVFDREPTVRRVTYLDTDVYFFGAPSLLLAELDGANAHVMLTEHARAPHYEATSKSGRFCVQFIPFRNSQQGRAMLRWWQERCVDWCFARIEETRFGDQKYLELWPSLWGSDVFVLSDSALTLAPWNVDYLLPEGAPRGIYHFQGLRLFAGGDVRLWRHFSVSDSSRLRVYSPYLDQMRNIVQEIAAAGIALPLASRPSSPEMLGAPAGGVGHTTEEWATL